MTTTSGVAGATQQAAGQTAGAAREQVSEVGSTAVGAASDVAGTAKEQVGAVAAEAGTQVKDLLDQARGQVTEQASGATQKLGESLRSLTAELKSMGEGSGDGSGPAAELARTVAGKGESLASFLDGKEPGELVQELRSFASRSPGTFLLGALAAGALAGRLTRGAKAAASDSASEYPVPGSAALPPSTSGAYTAPGTYAQPGAYGAGGIAP